MLICDDLLVIYWSKHHWNVYYTQNNNNYRYNMSLSLKYCLYHNSQRYNISYTKIFISFTVNGPQKHCISIEHCDCYWMMCVLEKTAGTIINLCGENYRNQLQSNLKFVHQLVSIRRSPGKVTVDPIDNVPLGLAYTGELVFRFHQLNYKFSLCLILKKKCSLTLLEFHSNSNYIQNHTELYKDL